MQPDAGIRGVSAHADNGGLLLLSGLHPVSQRPGATGPVCACNGATWTAFLPNMLGARPFL